MSPLSLLRFVHIAAGAVGLAVLLVPLLARKGGTVHRRVGAAFTWAMALNAATGVPLAVSKLPHHFAGGVFLLQVAALSASSTWLGLRALRAKGAPAEVSWRAERAVAAGLAISSALLLAYGGTQRSAVFIVFAALGLAQAHGWWRFFGQVGREKHGWLLMHMNGLGTSAIAAITAFVVTNSRYLGLSDSLQWIPWVMPGALLGTGLTLWQGWYRRRFEQSRVAAVAVTPHIPFSSSRSNAR